MNLKPLIFIYPLTETMKKLKEEVEKMPKSEGVEVYEVDELSEVAQLVPSVGQSLSIYGTPKKCAMALKQLRKINSKLNSKVLLLNDKSIPRKTLDKFSKIGLTEFIQEPVAPKTLLYKVKLQLKSIVVNEDNDEDEMGLKTSKEGQEEDEDLNYGKMKKKGNESEDGLDYLTNKQKKNDLVVEEEEEENKKKSFHEEDIESHWQGKMKKESPSEENKDNEKEEVSLQENSLDGYLRGSQKKSDQHQEEENKKSNFTDIVEDKNLQGEINENDEEEEYSIEKMKRSFEAFTEEELNKMKRSQSVEHSHYKGKVSNAEEELEDVDKSNSTLEIIDNDQKEQIEKNEEDLSTHKKSKRKLEIIEDIEDQIHESRTEEEEKSDDIKKRSSLDIEEEKSPSKGSTDHIENKDNSGESSTDQIDKYLRGGAAIRDEEQDNKDEKELEEVTLSLEDDEEDEEAQNTLDPNKEKRKKDHQLDIDLVHNDENKERNDNTEESGPEQRSKSQKQEEGSKEKNRSNGEAEEIEGHLRTSRNTDQEESSEKDGDKSKSKESLDKKNKTHESTVDDLTQEQLKANSKVDNIQTHYSSESTVSHIDDNWDFDHEESTNKKEEDKDKKIEMNMVYNEKIDLGEQTIDYRKLKDEFSGFTMDREGNNLKSTGPKYYGGGKRKKGTSPTYYSDNKSSNKHNDEENTSTDEEKQNKIFEPKSQGLENIVRILNFYNLESNAEEESYKFISNIIQKNFKGHLAVYYYDEKKSRVKEAINSLSLFDQSEESELQNAWTKLFSNNYRTWKDTKLPTWTDKTFEEKQIQFIYPYFEGASLMGFAVAWFIDGFNEERCKELEVNLESLRGFLISHLRKEMQAGKYNGATKENHKTKVNPIKSLFGRLFGKKAA